MITVDIIIIVGLNRFVLSESLLVCYGILFCVYWVKQHEIEPKAGVFNFCENRFAIIQSLKWSLLSMLYA